MKTLLFAIILLICSSQSFSQTISQCNPGDCPTSAFNSASTTFTMPGFPNCPITIFYLWRNCNGRQEIEIQGLGYNNPVSPFCSSFIAWLYDPLHGFDNQNLLWSTARQKVAEKIFIDLYATLSAPAKFLLQCPNGYLNYDFYTSVCNHYCSYDDSYHGMIVWAQLPCSITHCCQVTYKVCWNATTSQMDVIKTTTQTGGSTNCEITAPACPSTLPVPGAFLVGQVPNPMTYIDLGFSTSCGNTCE